MTNELSRRSLIRATGAAGVAALVPTSAGARHQHPAAPATPGQMLQAEAEAAEAPLYFFFTEPEAAFLTAAVDRLIPPDEQWAGAADAGVVTFIDRQLAGDYGQGNRLYLQGPWHPGTAHQGYQLPLTPAELYRIALRELLSHVEQTYGGRDFGQIDHADQDALLEALEAGDLRLEEIPGTVFFETLLANTIEGFFADPAYGGNRDMVGWRMVGFPGAFAQFAPHVEDHGVHYDRPPMSMAQASAHEDHH